MTMTSRALLGAALILGGMSALTSAQSGREGMNRRIEALLQQRLQAAEPVSVHADDITLAGDVIRLSGHARISVGDGFVLADGISIVQSSKRVTLTGNVRASLPASAAPAIPTPVLR
jgi:lipopolysaccharide assembly outer membrane protein LptD (OstA)